VRRVDAEILTSERQVAEFYEAAVEAYGRDDDKAQRMANWFIAELFRHIYAAGNAQDLRQIAKLPMTPAQIAALLNLVDEKIINANIAKKVLEMISQTGEDPKVVIEREGWAMVSDTSVIDDAIGAILGNYPDELARYKSGEDKLFGFFMGQVMRDMRGQADPQMLRERLQALLSE
jgi:aspartyl-tRNA(Asn)/glutamyl-tRNA(Gln) amidotransferase subunit B